MPVAGRNAALAAVNWQIGRERLPGAPYVGIMATQRRPEDPGPLRVRDAAWLARVNDDTIRTWARSADWPGEPPVDGEPVTVRWDDLDEYCRAHAKPRPLSPAALALTFDDLAAPTAAAPPPASAPPADALLRERLRVAEAERDRARRANQALRLALRERIAGAAHARSDAAASDRALTHILDAAEASGADATS
jgi:hypothetical protein